ncbi:MAG: UMP kinase [Halobacteriales archaeon]|nr:UMP kinase [Halobacteriales archaeon]
MKVVLSIGGSVLAPDLEPDRVREYADAVERLVEAGCSLGVVVGGGGVAREYIRSARALGANEIQLDQLGIAVTRLNARLLIAALGDRAAVSPADDYDEAVETMRRGEVAVMGGAIPGQTTDAVSAAIAEQVEADLLVFATSVDGVYSADPNENDDVEHYPELTAGELVEVISGIEMAAGSSAPVDLLGAKLIERSGMRTIVLDGADPDAVVDAVLAGEHAGTDILPGPDAPRPPLWDQG